MDEREKLLTILAIKLKEKGVDDEQHRVRLKAEIQEVKNQGEYEYFLELYEKGIRYPKNENNLLIPYLLGIVDDFDIANTPAFVYGEFPDIDVDYLPMVRDYLKNEWAPKTFGRENVCSIGNYTTFGIKSALIDMVRVYGLDRNEILKLTTKLPTKDEDGKELSFEAAIATSKELAEYCQKHPEVAEAAKRLVGRNRGKGKHAAGLIISRSRIDELVPLITDTDGTPISAWSEGLHTQDLQPVGLVKFDLLVITNLMQIAICTKLIKERHGSKPICALDGRPDWSDTSYLNDHKALTVGNNAKLRCVFQFDSDGIRELVRKGGVTSFDDLVAYTALYRPGPLGMSMDQHYVNRKKGDEDFILHPLMAQALDKTYGVLVYQEQVMRVLNIVGGIPLTDCEKVRKGISKKKEEVFNKYRPRFIQNGVKNLGWDEEAVKNLWDQIVSFAEYGFNKSHAVCYTYISARLLWLKTHYPLEFFTAILSCEDDADKIKEYRAEAERFGVRVYPVDINKSGVTFQICDDAIYIGFGNVNGIGTEMARRIVAAQPYASFEDFLARFGTDADAVKPLIGLRAFSEADPVVLCEFYEHFKNETKKRQEREKRHLVSRKKYAEQLRYLFAQAGQLVDAESFEREESLLQHWMGLDEQQFTGEVEQNYGFPLKDTLRILKAYRRCIETYQEKVQNDQPISLASFQATGELEDKVLQEIYESDKSEAEKKWYGFGWTHIIQKSPDYIGGMSFEDYQRLLETEGHGNPVEAWIVERPKETKSKNSDKIYYVMKIEDEKTRSEWVTLWPDDYERFKEELMAWESETRRGNLIRIRLHPPGNFKRYKLEPLPWNDRQRLKKHDARLVVMQKPPQEAKTKAEVVSALKELTSLNE